MPYTYAVDATRDAVFVRAVGVVTDQELISAAEDIASAPHYHRGIRFCADYTGVTQNEITPKGFREAATILQFPPIKA